MDNIEEKLGAILNDPKAMQQIMALAQSLGNNSQDQPPKSAANPSQNGFPDPAMIRKLSSLSAGSSIDPNQKQLLKSLTPYLSSDRVSKLENAMRAAKIAKLASAFLSGGGLQLLGGR